MSASEEGAAGAVTKRSVGCMPTDCASCLRRCPGFGTEEACGSYVMGTALAQHRFADFAQPDAPGAGMLELRAEGLERLVFPGPDAQSGQELQGYFLMFSQP